MLKKRLSEKSRRGVYFITRRCDLRCWYCNVPRIHANKKDELGIDGIRKVISNLKRLGVDFITIFGGEPMLRYQEIEEVLPQIVEFAYPIINTNGRLIVESERVRESYRRMVNIGMNNMSVSIDKMVEDTDDFPDGSEEKSWYAWEALEIARNFGVTDLSINGVIDTAKPHDVIPVIEKASELGYDVRLSLVQTPKVDTESESFFFGQTHMEKEALDDVLHMILNNIDGWNVKTTPGYFESIINGTNDSFVCNTPGYIVVTPDGRYQLCQNIYGEELLNLPLDTSWEDYENAWYKDLDKHCPGCYLNCHVDYHIRHELWNG